MRRPGRDDIVEKEVIFVSARPPASVAVTRAVYVRPNFRALAGTHAEPSSRRVPETFRPLSSVTTTAVTAPPVTAVPISVLIGRFLALGGGVMAKVNGSAGGAGLAGPLGVAPAAAST